MTDPVQLLEWNAGVQIAFSSLFGWLLLVPRQPWGEGLKRLRAKAFTAAHLDWLLLAFMQFGASYTLARHTVPHAGWVAVALVIGGWLNPVPYVMRGLGVDAFAMAGGPVQRASAALSAASSLLITASWITIAIETLP